MGNKSLQNKENELRTGDIERGYSMVKRDRTSSHKISTSLAAWEKRGLFGTKKLKPSKIKK